MHQRAANQSNQYFFLALFCSCFLIFLVILVVFVASSRKAYGLTFRDKAHNFARTPRYGVRTKYLMILLIAFKWHSLGVA
jgi:hypothetical protein